MKYVLGILILSFISFGASAEPNAPQSYVEGQVAAAEVFQVSLPEIKVHTEDGIRKFQVTLESTLGDIEKQWLLNRLAEIRRSGSRVEFMVVGSDTKNLNYIEAVKLAEEVKYDSENLIVEKENIHVPKELGKGMSFKAKKIIITLLSMTISGGSTAVGVYFGTDIPFEYMTLMASQSALISGAFTLGTVPYANWLKRSGLFPKKDAPRAGHVQTFMKSWAVSTTLLYLLKQSAVLMPIYHGVTNPVAILSDAAFIGLQGLFSKFFYHQARNLYVDKVLARDPSAEKRMELWMMKTGIAMSVVFGITEQLANFHVPGASYALLGLGAGGILLYKYMTNLKVKDIMRAIFTRKIPLSAISLAGTCSFLFLYN